MVLATTIYVAVTQASPKECFAITMNSIATLTTYARQHHLQLPLPSPMHAEMITLYLCQGDRLRVVADPWYMEGNCMS